MTPLKTFICYAHEDRTTVEGLLKHLRLLEKKELLEIWDDGQILAGQDWDKSIKRRLENAQMILMFVSVDFISSEYIETTELKAALQRHTDGEATLVPIIVRSCDWADYFDIGRFQALPKQAHPIHSRHFTNLDEALHEVAQGVRLLVEELRAKWLKEAEVAQQEAAQKLAAEKQLLADKARKGSLQKQDETAWTEAEEAAKHSKSERDQMAAYQVYLDDIEHVIYREAAEKAIAALKAQEMHRKIKEKQKEAAKREQEAVEEVEIKLKEKQKAEGRKKKEAESAEKKRLAEEAARLKGLPEMVFVKGDTFQMGSAEIGDAKPIHIVTLSDFEIGKYPVTQKLWQEIMGDNPSKFKENENCPVEKVSWVDVQEFLKKLNTHFPGLQYRLPTEAEWEYAAAGGLMSQGFRYAGSDHYLDIGWFRRNARSKTHPVGLKKANELGIHDMSGNVWEWCADWYGKYTSGRQINPQGPESGSFRVFRGGSWKEYLMYCKITYRDFDSPRNRKGSLGFRLARTI